jgi:cytochrome c oxidase subunit II
VTRSLRRSAALAATVSGVLLMTGCSDETTQQWKRLGLPEGASDRTSHMENLWVGSWIAALIVGVLVWGLILWVVVRYRLRDDGAPRQIRYNLPLEALYTLAPFAVIGVLFFYTEDVRHEVAAAAQGQPHTINVVGQQWQWTFNYDEQVEGESERGVWETGTIANPAVLWLPVNEPIKFELTSPDVVHSFWVPAFYFKRDVIPGRSGSFELTPTRTGTFAGRCAELCGLYHSRMTFTVRVVTRAEYEAHLKELAEKGQTGAATGGEDANTISGNTTEGEK